MQLTHTFRIWNMRAASIYNRVKLQVLTQRVVANEWRIWVGGVSGGGEQWSGGGGSGVWGSWVLERAITKYFSLIMIRAYHDVPLQSIYMHFHPIGLDVYEYVPKQVMRPKWFILIYCPSIIAIEGNRGAIRVGDVERPSPHGGTQLIPIPTLLYIFKRIKKAISFIFLDALSNKANVSYT